MTRKIIRLLILIALFCGCRSPAMVNIKGRYFLENDDFGRYVGYQTEQQEISLILVDGYVFAAGYNDKFIVAIRHPKTRTGISADSDYYIIPFRKDYTYSPQDGIIGPLTFKDYTQKINQLGIRNVNCLNVY